jgi:hypothetical protein
MKPLSPDTSQQAQRKQYEMMSQLSPTQRLKLAFDLTESTRKLVIADLRHRYPEADEVSIPRGGVIRACGFVPRTEEY